MRFGLPISLFMHGTFLFGGLLMWNNNATEFTELRIIPLDLVTVSDVTNIKTTRKKSLPDPIAEPEVESVPEIPEEIEVEPEPELIPQDDADAEPVPETKPKDEKPKQQASFDLDAFASMVDQARKENPNANNQTVLQSEIGERDVNGVGQGTGMTVDKVEYIRAKMRNCYKIDTGAKDYRDLRVEVRLHLNVDGKVEDIDILNNTQIIASPNNAWRAARDNVVFALNDCAPYDKLPKAEFGEWKSTRLNFQPAKEDR